MKKTYGEGEPHVPAIHFRQFRRVKIIYFISECDRGFHPQPGTELPGDCAGAVYHADPEGAGAAASGWRYSEY